MAQGLLSIEIQANLTVSDETAERCLKLLEMWQEDNPDSCIVGEKIQTTAGIKTVFKIVRRDEESK